MPGYGQGGADRCARVTGVDRAGGRSWWCRCRAGPHAHQRRRAAAREARAGHRAARALPAGPAPCCGGRPMPGTVRGGHLIAGRTGVSSWAGPPGGPALPVLFPGSGGSRGQPVTHRAEPANCARAVTMRSAEYSTTGTPSRPPATRPATGTPPSAREIFPAAACGGPDPAAACPNPGTVPDDQLQPAGRRRSRHRPGRRHPAVHRLGPAGFACATRTGAAVRTGGKGQRNRHSQEGPIRLLADPDCVVCGPLAHIPASSRVPSCALPIIVAHDISAQGPKSGIGKTCGPRPAPPEDADQAALQRAHDGTGPGHRATAQTRVATTARRTLPGSSRAHAAGPSVWLLPTTIALS
jgi:hypothetical protein